MQIFDAQCSDMGRQSSSVIIALPAWSGIACLWRSQLTQDPQKRPRRCLLRVLCSLTSSHGDTVPGLSQTVTLDLISNSSMVVPEANSLLAEHDASSIVRHPLFSALLQAYSEFSACALPLPLATNDALPALPTEEQLRIIVQVSAPLQCLSTAIELFVSHL